MNRPLQVHRTRLILACFCATLLMMLAACGQKGPLYLPEDTEQGAARAEQEVDDGQKSGGEDEDEEGAGR